MIKCAPYLAWFAVLCASCVSPPNGESDCSPVDNKKGSERSQEVLDRKASKWFDELLIMLPPAASVDIDSEPWVEAAWYQPTYDVIAYDSPGWEERAVRFLVEIPHNLDGSLDYMPYKVWAFKKNLAWYLFCRVGLPISLDIAVSKKLAVSNVDNPCYIAMLQFPYWTATRKLAAEKIKAWISQPDSRNIISWLFYTANIDDFAADILPYVKRIAKVKDKHTEAEFTNLSGWLHTRNDTAIHWRKKFSEQVADSPFKGRFTAD